MDRKSYIPKRELLLEKDCNPSMIINDSYLFETNFNLLEDFSFKYYRCSASGGPRKKRINYTLTTTYLNKIELEPIHIKMYYKTPETLIEDMAKIQTITHFNGLKDKRVYSGSYSLTLYDSEGYVSKCWKLNECKITSFTFRNDKKNNFWISISIDYGSYLSQEYGENN
jgi:hypothetical protein